MTSLTNQIRDYAEGNGKLFNCLKQTMTHQMHIKLMCRISYLMELLREGFYFCYKVYLCLNNRKGGGRQYDTKGRRSFLNSMWWGTGDI